jgi:hypothetical protein
VPSAVDIRRQIDSESERRGRLAVPAFAGGFLYVLSAIVVSATEKGAPTVGLLDGLGPALRGEADPLTSPATAEVKFISHHAFSLIAGGVLGAISIAALVLVLLLLRDATRFRRPETWAAAGPILLTGGIFLPLLNIVHAILLSIKTHSFAVGHDFTVHAVQTALLASGSVGVILGFAGLLAALALAVGTGAVMVGAIRVGLVPRWMGIVGVLAGLLFLPFFNSPTLELVPALWLVMMGILYAGRWPNAEPPAWAAGEARPWPSGAQARAAKSGGEVVPAPSLPAQAGTSRKRRKRGARG